ncbi:hypothetical protein QMA15_32150, partial [Rhodococcus sp. APC 3903]|nr:hypothetical protein [Rhodococcus sp. APC 3903]
AEHSLSFSGQNTDCETVPLLSLQDMISVRKMMLEVVGVRSGYASYAGYPAYGFVPEYIPFAERDGYLLVTDMWGAVGARC